MYPAFGCFIAVAIMCGHVLDTKAMGICAFQLRFPGYIQRPSESHEIKTNGTSTSANVTTQTGGSSDEELMTTASEALKATTNIVTQIGGSSEKLPNVTLMTTVLNGLKTTIADTTNPLSTSQTKGFPESVSNEQLMTSALEVLTTTAIGQTKTPSLSEEVTQIGGYPKSLPYGEPMTTLSNELTTAIADTTNPISTSQARGAFGSVSYVEIMTSASEVVAITIAGCSPWNTHGNYMYMIPEGERSYNESRQLCQDCGGDIAVINDSDVSGTIKNIMLDIGGGKNGIWIGITRIQPERVHFAWLDGRLFSEQDSSWSKNQPNDSTGQQNCVASFGYDSQLQDKICTERHYALCQKV